MSLPTYSPSIPLFGNEDGVYARVMADSVNGNGERVTTMEVQCHRFVLAEFNTHRVFSRNSASSRAIPFEKQVERVLNNPAIPLSFPIEKKGMSGGDEVLSPRAAEGVWLDARDKAVESAQYLAAMKVHKSVVNRILEPFMWHKIIVTATEWDNFFDLRISPQAQPEINALATQMLAALNASDPDYLTPGTWHTPYITEQDWMMLYDGVGEHWENAFQMANVVSAARCARVSYLTHDGQRDFSEDVRLFNTLVTNGHWSPLEHVCTPYAPDTVASLRLGNLTGWQQLRHTDLEPVELIAT